jgi:hypothetical protein
VNVSNWPTAVFPKIFENVRFQFTAADCERLNSTHTGLCYGEKRPFNFWL